MANTQLSDATHIMTFIAINCHNPEIPSADIAESVQTSPSLVRRLMSKLKQANLLHAVQGAAHPTLARPADQISLLDIYLAVLPEHQLLNVDQHTDQACPVGANIPDVLTHYYDEIQTAAEAQMSRITLQNVIDGVSVAQQRKTL